MCNFQALVLEDLNYVARRYKSRKYAIDQSVTNQYLKVRLPYAKNIEPVVLMTSVRKIQYIKFSY